MSGRTRRRSLHSPPAMLRRKRESGRLTRWRGAVVNWLNGLPVHPDDGFESASVIGSPQPGAPGRRGSKIKKNSWFGLRRKKRRASLAPAVVKTPELIDRQLAESGIGNAGEGEPISVNHPAGTEGAKEIEGGRQPVRIIQLPPIFAKPTLLLNQKDDITSETVSNEIRTAKYTFWNFLPKNLLEQMRRVANIYFVLLIMLQAVPAISNYSPFMAALPVLIILGVTAAKDAVEDWKRHRQDDEVNYAICRVLNRPGNEQETRGKTRWHRISAPVGRFLLGLWEGSQKLIARIRGVPYEPEVRIRPLAEIGPDSVDWKEIYWRDLRVGDIILIRNDEMIPADVMVFSCSEPDGVCFVETKNLDGETNLKPRLCPAEMDWICTPEDAYNLKATVEVELPNSHLYTFMGKILLSKSIPSPITPPDGQADKEMEEKEFGGVLADSRPGSSLNLEQGEFIDSAIIPVTSSGLLLRGCIIRNTDYVIGVVVYTGPDTKLVRNAGETPSKRTRIERQMNPQIILSFVLLFIICLSCAIVQSQFASASSNAPYWVAAFDQGILTSNIFLGFLTFWSSLILFQTLVPISMYVTVEMVKTIQAFFISNDVKIYHPETDQRAVPRAWNLADDLGQIQYLFSDKTGTLTQNIMEFRRCSIGGKIYGNRLAAGNQVPPPVTRETDLLDEQRWARLEQLQMEQIAEMLPYPYVPPSRYSFVDPTLIADVRQGGETAERIKLFFSLLAICHTVLIDKAETREKDLVTPQGIKPHALLFKAQSPDEAALVSIARDLGFVFLGRDKDIIYISILGSIESITVLNVLEFTSARKRMSVIVRRANNETYLLCKGADNIIYERLAPHQGASEEAKQTQRHLESFAEDGLRTLCLAYRRIDDEKYFEWARSYSEASVSMHNRDLLMDALADEIESELTLLGATAIEDRLQEGVPECIEVLQQAGIKIWVLTGDKMETAINIGFSCRLLRKDMILLVIKGSDRDSTKAQLHNAYERVWSRYFSFGQSQLDLMHASNTGAAIKYAMIIEGSTLKFALDKECRQLFVELSSQCEAVICCRVSPLQKARVVELIKKSKNAMTMAIGDGANDVSMIQAADVGVGVAGQEGMQAVMSSDYAIAQFRFLRRLLLVHGRWAYLRVAEVTLISLYKNVAFVVLLFWYQFYCGFTAQYIYDYMFLLFFNLLFSTLPLLILGLFDRDLPDNYLTRIPPIYKLGARQKSYSMKRFSLYILDAIWQSLVCFFIPLLTYRDTALAVGGQTETQTMLGNAMAFPIIFVVNLYVAVNSYALTTPNIVSIVLTLMVTVGCLLVYSLIPTQTLYGTWIQFLQPTFWLTCTLAIVVSLTPRILAKYIQATWYPTDLDLVREVCKWKVGEADLVRTLRASFAAESMATTAGMSTQQQPLAQLPKAMVRVSPRKLLGVELPEQQSPLMPLHEPISAGAAEAGEARPPGRSRPLTMFNMRTGRFEKMRGFAFSQEAGVRDVIVNRRTGEGRRATMPDLKCVRSFGSVYLDRQGLSSDPALRGSRPSQLSIHIPELPSPDAVAQRNARHTRRPNGRRQSRL